MQTGAFKGFTGFTGFGSGSAGYSFGSGASGLVTGAVSQVSSAITDTAASVPASSTVSNATRKPSGVGFGFTAIRRATDNGTMHSALSKSIEPKSSADNLPAA